MSSAARRFHLGTSRLELVPFEPRDAPALHAIFTEPAVRRYLLDDRMVPLAWVEGEIAGSRAAFEQHGYGLWTLRLRAGEPIGFAGFREFHDPPELQLLYGLHPAHWGRGLATEAAHEVTRYGFEAIGFEEIVASTDAANAASVRVMERLGMRFLKREEKAGLDTIYYVLERADRGKAG